MSPPRRPEGPAAAQHEGPPATGRSPPARRAARPAGSVRLSARHEALLCGVLAGLVATGVVWLIYHHLVPLDESVAVHPQEAWSIRVHGGLAMAALVLVGSLLPRHVVTAWRLGRNRGSGGLMLGAMLFLTVTGYLLYYAGSPALRDATSWLHWGAGLSLPALLWVHMARGGRWRRRHDPA